MYCIPHYLNKYENDVLIHSCILLIIYNNASFEIAGKMRESANKAFEMGLSMAANDIYDNFRSEQGSPSIELVNIDLNGVCAKYNLNIEKCTTLPLLMKHLVEHLIRRRSLNACFEGGVGNIYALGK